MTLSIKVEYFGTVRLILCKKEDIFEFQEMPSLGVLLQNIGQRYGAEILEECKRQAIFLRLPQDEVSRQIRFPDDQYLGIENGSTVKMMSMISGG